MCPFPRARICSRARAVNINIIGVGKVVTFAGWNRPVRVRIDSLCADFQAFLGQAGTMRLRNWASFEYIRSSTLTGGMDAGQYYGCCIVGKVCIGCKSTASP